MENYEYHTVESSLKPESKIVGNPPESGSNSAEDQYFNLPLKERMKIQSKRLKSKMKVTSKELAAKAKNANKELHVKSKALHAKMLEKKRKIDLKIHTKLEEHKAAQKLRRDHQRSSKNVTPIIPVPETTKYCHACGHEVGAMGKFCPACGSTQ